MKIFKKILPYSIILVFILVFSIALTLLAKKQKKEFKPDGIVIHSYDCKGPYGKHAPKDYGNPLNNYHYMVKKDGTILRGKPGKKILPHIGSKFLHRSLSVMVEGNFQKGPFINSLSEKPALPQKQFISLKKLLFMLMKKNKIPLAQIERHMDHDERRNCPGSGFPYFEVLYSMSLDLIRKHGNKPLEEICREKGVKIPIENARMVIDKSKFKMDLYAGDVHLKTYSIGLSRKPKGDKVKYGDLKTPVGDFYITEKYPMRAWMEISYPDKKHLKMGLKRGLIDKKTYKKALVWVERGGIPPHGTKIGDDVGMHAGGFPYKKMRKNSTAGCVSLEDPEAFEIYYAIPLGAGVKIGE
ncbi:MAG: N-acetylmuramoyl-L-alanine amidase [Candidatus Eremiobacteraeota bacterium]|nr:N-acetylmuramoyl-L-alanine amidase [Candidatus Eremiobacteraeota bacterium]